MFRALSLRDKALFDKFKTEEITHSQYNFTNLYMWKHEYNPEIDVIDGCLCVVLKYFGHTMAMFPYGNSNIKSALDEVFSVYGNITVTALDSQRVLLLKELYPDTFKFVNVRNNYDYVYTAEKLINLSGRKLHSKRNHLKRFLNNYNFEYRSITSDNIEDCIRIEKEWLSGKGFAKSAASSEFSSTMNLLDNFEFLNCRGGIIYVDGYPRAYAVGEMMNSQMAVIHIEKATGEFEGIYAAVNNLVAKNEFSDAKLINREEDMGREMLRKAKLSYYPDMMIEYKRARFVH